MARVGLVALSALTIGWALGVILFGIVDIVTQLAAGQVRVTMLWNSNDFRFTDTGDGRPGAPQIFGGTGGPIDTTITGLSASAVAVHVLARIAALLPQLVLALVAVRLIRRLLAGRVFARAAARDAAVAAIALLAIGTISQMLAWWSRVVIVDESGGGTFSRRFDFDPLAVTGGLVLLLVAAVFRIGERIQRDTEGLV